MAARSTVQCPICFLIDVNVAFSSDDSIQEITTPLVYCAPEALFKSRSCGKTDDKLNQATDIWSPGCLVYLSRSPGACHCAQMSKLLLKNQSLRFALCRYTDWLQMTPSSHSISSPRADLSMTGHTHWDSCPNVGHLTTIQVV